VVIRCIIFIVIDSETHCEIRIRSRSRNENLLGPSREMLGSTITTAKESSGLKDDIGIPITPRQISGVPLGCSVNFVSIHNDMALIIAHFASELALRRVILEKVSEGLVIGEIVDSDDFFKFVISH
jgi:hypothetical protein